MIELALLVTEEAVRQCYPVMHQLRPHMTEHVFVEQVMVQQETGYQLLGAFENGQCVGLAGFVLGHKLAWGKHAYIDDLVTKESNRSSGVGQALLAWVCDYARQHKCGEVHLDSGVQRFAAHRFYLRQHFDITSHHFAKSL